MRILRIIETAAACFMTAFSVLPTGQTQQALGGASAGKARKPTVDTPLPLPGMGWSTYNFFLAAHNEELFKRMVRRIRLQYSRFRYTPSGPLRRSPLVAMFIKVKGSQ